MRLTTPWGPLCSLNLTDRQLSDDGPILWVRPGEQMIASGESLTNTPRKKKMCVYVCVVGGREKMCVYVQYVWV